jgi:hypothetical protein
VSAEIPETRLSGTRALSSAKRLIDVGAVEHHRDTGVVVTTPGPSDWWSR